MSSPLLLEGRSEFRDETPTLRREIERLVGELRRTEGELRQAQDEALAARQAVSGLRRLLAPLWGEVQALRDDSPRTANLQGNSKWAAIKQRLAPRLQDAIDIFLSQGTMTSSALAAALKTSNSNCSTNVVGPLLRQGLLVRNGRELQLKSLE